MAAQSEAEDAASDSPSDIVSTPDRQEADNARTMAATKVRQFVNHRWPACRPAAHLTARPPGWNTGRMDDTTNARNLVVGAGAITFAWYALPDLVRSRALRGLLKAGMLVAVTAATPCLLPADSAPEPDELPWPPPPAILAAGTAALAGSTAATVWGERAIFRLGERRRARGVRCAHALPALGLAALSALSVAVLIRPEPDGQG